MTNKEIAAAKMGAINPEMKANIEKEMRIRAHDFSTKAQLVVFPEITRHFLATEDRQLQMFKMAQKEKQEQNKDITDEDVQKAVEEFASRMCPWVNLLIIERTFNLVGALTKENFPDIYPKPEPQKEAQNDAPVVVEAEVEVEKPIRRISEETKGVRSES